MVEPELESHEPPSGCPSLDPPAFFEIEQPEKPAGASIDVLSQVSAQLTRSCSTKACRSLQWRA